MNEFVLIFRNGSTPGEKQSPEQMQAVMKQWQDWIGSIAAQKKLSGGGNRLGNEGKLLKANNIITNGPFEETKAVLSGYIIVKTNTIEEAVEEAKRCPIFETGGSVEVRDVLPMNL